MHSLQLHRLTLVSSVHNQLPVRQISPFGPRRDTAKLQTPLPCEEIFSNVLTSLRISIENQSPKLGSCIHARVLKSGLDTNVIVKNSLLDMYTKCGQLENAGELFEHMLERTVVSWTSMMSGYCHKGLADEAISLFWQMLEILQPNEYTLAVILQACAQKADQKMVLAIHGYIIKYGSVTDSFLQNSLIDAYAKFGMLAAAEKLLERCNCRDVVSWTAVISGCVCNGMEEKALVFFSRMQEDGVKPNEVTVLSILQACSSINDRRILGWIHGFVIKAEWGRDALVMNSLVEMYSTNAYFHEVTKIFCSFCFSGEGMFLSQETMATLLQGCDHSSSLKLGEEIHGYLIKHGFLPRTIVENSLINMYAENERGNSAFQLFTRMSRKDISSWNTMIACLAKNERSSEALELLTEIHSSGARDEIFPDFITMLSSLQACSNLASLQPGQVIHGYVTRTGLARDIFVQNSLIDMYGKSGRLDSAERIFEEMPERDLGSWNSIIAAYGNNGNGTSALQIFAALKKLGIYQPNAITYINILSACAHAGFIEAGFEIFRSMQRDYDIEPSMEHFACLVDLLGRSGRLYEAEAFIKSMPLRPGPEVWGSLLGACVLFGNIEIAERAAKRLSVLEPKSNVWRVALSNVYATVGRWNDTAKVRAEMRGSEKLRKEGGWSSVEVRGDIFRFMVGETTHPESKMIYEVLNGIQEQIRDATILDIRVP